MEWVHKKSLERDKWKWGRFYEVVVYYRPCGWTLATCLSVTAANECIFPLQFRRFTFLNQGEEVFDESTEPSPNLCKVTVDFSARQFSFSASRSLSVVFFVRRVIFHSWINCEFLWFLLHRVDSNWLLVFNRMELMKDRNKCSRPVATQTCNNLVCGHRVQWACLYKALLIPHECNDIRVTGFTVQHLNALEYIAN